ncbi:MAG: phospholipid/cholesterol/gamma-HCH transport system substrate-binding protein [Solirubrobacteraceae bacterium]|nr:phospholipid/cholesterol/gamma-HCH transport system substrate-binding protein [Solirubrobacteraceae bacterium]
MSPLFGRKDTRLRKDRTGANPFTAGLVVLIIIGIGTYFGFAKHVPFTHGYQLKAVFTSANSIRKNSPVRIAGVNVGKVKGIDREPGSNAALVTMEIADMGLPIHKDASLKIRPRIFLEGNFFVDLQPGTPSSPDLSSGDTVPITQTAVPVQLDQVLTTLQSNTRADLQDLLKNYGEALTSKPTAADNASQDPEVRGLTGAQALNKAAQYGAPAFRDSAIVQQAFLGTQPHDLSAVVSGVGHVTRALDANEADLQDLVTNFNRTMAVFAGESTNLSQTVHLLPGVLQNANRALASLNNAFPATRAFAREILPGVRETPATINAFFPWIAQARPLLGQAELRGLVADLQPATHDLANVTDPTVKLLPQADLVAKCFTDVVLPTGDIKINDTPALTTGRENYKEFWYTMVGLAGEGQNFDGNGMYVRFQPGGGDQTISTGQEGGPVGNQSLGETLFTNPGAPPLGTRPAYPSLRPPYNYTTPCYTNKIPDLNGARTGRPDGTQPAARSIGRPQAPAPAPATSKRTAKANTGSLTAALAARLNPFRKAGR